MGLALRTRFRCQREEKRRGGCASHDAFLSNFRNNILLGQVPTVGVIVHHSLSKLPSGTKQSTQSLCRPADSHCFISMNAMWLHGVDTL